MDEMMRAIVSVFVAFLALYIADMAFTGGRYFQPFVTVFRHLAGRFGYDF